MAHGVVVRVRGVRALGLAVAVALVCALVPIRPETRPAQADAPPSSARGTIIFTTGFMIDPIYADWGYQIWTMNPDGTQKRALTTDPLQQPYTAVVNPAGNTIAFTTGGRTLQRGGLYLLHLDSIGLTNILAKAAFMEARNPSWSPDGRQLVFVGLDASFKHDLWVVNADGSGLHRVTSCGCAFYSTPRWSPVNPDQVLWSPRQYDLALLSLATGQSRQLYDNAPSGAIDILNYAWSPDGTRIAVEGGPWNDVTSNIYTMNADGSGLTVLADSPTRTYTHPVWSPDGRQLAMSASRTDLGPDAAPQIDVLLMSATQGTAGATTSLPMALKQEVTDWARPCTRSCSPAGRSSAITLHHTQTHTSDSAAGGVVPYLPGGTVLVTLEQQAPSAWVAVRRVTTSIDRWGMYRATFRRSNASLCRLSARYTGDTAHNPSLVTSPSFGC